MAKAEAAPRKRPGRRRKRREVSESSSSADDTGSDSDAAPATVVKNPPTATTAAPPTESSDDTESDSSDSDSSDSDVNEPSAPQADVEMTTAAPPEPPKARKRPASRSPSPPSAALPPFLPKDDGGEKEKLLKERFRKYWMASIADGFADDLEEIRKEPSMTKSRLDMLIDSLASGADVFSSTADESSRRRTTEEMELVLGAR